MSGKTKPTEPGYYFYCDEKGRRLVSISSSWGRDGSKGPLLAEILEADGKGLVVSRVKDLSGTWSEKLKQNGPGSFENPEAQRYFKNWLALNRML